MVGMETKKFFVAMTISVERPGLPNMNVTYQGSVDVERGTHQSRVYNDVANYALQSANLAGSTWYCKFFSMMPDIVWD